MVFTLIYVSDSTINMFGEEGTSQLGFIKNRSTFNNDIYDVRGFLFYFQNRFLQILQGEFDGLISIFGKIKEDPRHKNVRILWFSDQDKFQFESWAMATSIEYARDHYKELTVQSSLVGRFIPERGHLTPEAQRVLVAFATEIQSGKHNVQQNLTALG